MFTRKFGGALGRHRIGQAADPAVLLAAVGRGGVPVRHRREVRERRVLVSAAVHDGQLAVLIRRSNPAMPPLNPKWSSMGRSSFLRDADVAGGACSRRRRRREPACSVRRCRPTVPAPPGSFRSTSALSGQRGGRLPEQRARGSAAPAVTPTPYMPARKQIAPAEFRKTKSDSSWHSSSALIDTRAGS